MTAGTNTSYYTLTSFLTPNYSTCNGTKYLAGGPQKGSSFDVRLKPASLTSVYVRSVEINATIIFGGVWASGTRLVLTTYYTYDPLVILTKNDIINAASVDLSCGGTPLNSSYEDYTYNLSVTFYYLYSSIYIGHSATDPLWRMITVTADNAWVAIRDVYMTFQTTPSYSTCPSKTYRPSTYTGDPCVCNLKTK